MSRRTWMPARIREQCSCHGSQMPFAKPNVGSGVLARTMRWNELNASAIRASRDDEETIGAGTRLESNAPDQEENP